MRFDDLPYEPEPAGISSFMLPSAVERLKERVYVDERGGQPVAHLMLGTIRPGEEARCEQDLVILPSIPGVYELKIRVLASEVGSPIEKIHSLAVDGSIETLDLDGLHRLLLQDIVDRLDQN